jgi:hypothetical protein
VIERKITRRKGGPLDSPTADRRRPAYERRGTVPAAPQPPREVHMYGERRLLPDAGLE